MKRAFPRIRPAFATGLYVVLVVVASVVIAGGCRRGAAQTDGGPEQELAVPVDTVEAQLGSLSETIEVTGTVKSLNEVSVGTTMPDKVTYLCGKEGDPVKAGQVICRMETKELDASIAQASALAEGARVAVEQARQGHTYQDVSLQNNISAAENRVQAARNQLDQARTARELLARGVEDGVAAARTQVAQAESGVQQAKIAVDTARLSLSQTETGSRSGVDAAEAAVRAAEASYANLRNGARSQERAQAEESVRQAELAVDNARRDLQRLAALRDAGAASQQTVDTAQLQYDTAASRLSQAQQALSLTREGATQEQLTIAQEQIAQAKANLLNARSGSDAVEQRRQAVAAAEESVRIAEQSLAAARIGLVDAENKRLQVRSADVDIDNAQKALEAAEIARNQAQAGEITLQVDEKEVARAVAALKSAQASVALYAAQRSKRILISPVSGRILARNADVGEIAPATMPVMTIVAEDTLEFEATVSELDVTRLQTGDAVDVTVDGAGEGTVIGRLVSVLPAGDAASRMFTIKVSVPAEGGVKPGMFARGQVKVRENPSAITVPKDVLIESGGSVLVYVVEDGVAKRRELRLGIEGDGVVEVVEGLTPGEQVVIHGKETLSDGVRVEARLVEGGGPEPAADLTSAAPESTVAIPAASAEASSPAETGAKAE